MLFLKRTVPLIITFFTGIIVILAFFSGPAMPVKGLDEKASEWAQVVMTFTMVLGAVSLFQINLFKISAKREGWQFNVVLLAGFCIMAILSFLHGIQTTIVKGGTYYQVNTDKQYTVVDFKLDDKGQQVAALVKSEGDTVPVEMATTNLRGSFDNLIDKWWKFFFDGVFKAANATMFSLLAFFVASASFRAFKVKSREAALLMVAAFVVMLGNVPVGFSVSSFLSWLLWPVLAVITKVIQAVGGLFRIPVTTEVLTVDLAAIKEWIMKVPSSAAQSAILIGATLGYISAALKVILGVERSYLGGEK
ncbi:MAG TPA: hypothetical protein PKO06_17540 [Candidatus Ozemobacteraceae bacterium]|nr:hypothetical protein [Candidatus Ozemobacteraceae bacterium]